MYYFRHFQTCAHNRCDTHIASGSTALGCFAVFGWEMWTELSNLCNNPSLQNGPNVYVRFVHVTLQYVRF